MPPSDLERLARARAQLTELSAERIDARARLSAAREELARLERTAASAAERRRARSAVTTLEHSEANLLESHEEIRSRIGDLRDRLRLARPEDSIARLAGHVPISLLPVRLETRFTDRGRSLRIRVYPEQLHIDNHEPELTEDELAAGRRYWTQRWESGDDREVAAAAWASLARLTRPTRARWIVSATTPDNIDRLGHGAPEFGDVALRPGPWTRAPLARLLPEQWVALGYRSGEEVFRVWGAPVAEEVAVAIAPDLDDDAEPAPPPDTQDELPIDDGMRWMVDYDEALEVGMAVTVTDGDLSSGRLADGIDELLVLGADWSLDPREAAARLAEQLDRHAVSDGLALLGPGTPTNNTDEVRAGPGTDPFLDIAALDPASPRESEAGVRVARALGVTGSSGLTAAPGSGSLDDGLALHMHTALWAPTLGYFFDQIARPLVASEAAASVREHARRHVRGGGPFPALRVGRQPYGILPVLHGELVSDDPFEAGLAARLTDMRWLWSAGAEPIPRLGDSERPDVDLLDLLRRTPRSATYRFREAVRTTYASSILGFDIAARVQEALARAFLGMAGITGETGLVGIVADPNHRDVPVPLVTFGELSETDPLDPDYITAVLSQSAVAGGFHNLLAEPGEATTLLDALLRHAAGLEIAIGATLLVIEHELATRVVREVPRVLAMRDREVHDLELREIGGGDEPVSLLERADGVVEVADTSIRAVSGSRTLADHLLTRSNTALLERVPTRRFGEFRTALRALAQAPTAELARQAADVLDCASHRLDAWITSLATRRLDTIRDEDPGCHLGAFGYVEDLAPSARRESAGYLHGPSLAHATTAAVMRSGHLARRGDDAGLLATDLTSRRVSRGLELIEGVRRGQEIGALLGYRFERGLRDRRMQLARYILPFRKVAPLASSSVNPPTGEAVESIAARDVVDGLRLLERWRADADELFDAGEVAEADRPDLDAILRDMDDVLDSVSDLLVAESVHQAVLGNAERSAAALDALDRQKAMPEIGFVATPRTGSGLQHHLLVLASDPAPADGWEGIDDPRRDAEPRVDAWVGAVLGPPDRVRFGARVLDAEGETLQTVTARLSELGLSALATVCACAHVGDAPTELEERLALHLGGLVTAADAAELVLLEEPPSGSPAAALGLRQVLDLGRELLDLLSSARPADARSVASQVDRPEAGHDADELEARADAAAAALASARTALAALALAPPDPGLADSLVALADAGQRLAVPRSDDPAALAEQVEAALAAADRVLAGLTELEVSFDRSTATDAAAVAHDLARIRAVFGEGFPVLPAFQVPNADELAASVADPGLFPGEETEEDPFPAVTWLGRHALVRPAVARLVEMLEASEMLGGSAAVADVAVAQLPHRPGARWCALPLAEDEPPPVGSASIVWHAAGEIDFSAPLAGLVVDRWSEVIPTAYETTGLSFHFDAPGARAPQIILLAVPGDPETPSWTVEALAGTVREAMELARIRARDLDDLAAVGRFLPAIYLPFNIEGKTPSLNLAGLIAHAVEFHNVAFLEER